MAIIADAEIRFRSVGDDRTLSSLRRVSAQVRTTSRDSMNAVRGVNSFSTSLRSLGRIAAGGLSLTGVIAGFRGLITAAAESEDAGDRLATVFGSMATEANELAETLGQAINVSTRETQDFLATIGTITQAAGASTEATLGFGESFIRLAGDLGSFHSEDPVAVINALRSAIFLGNSESLETLTNINLSATALRDYADEVGVTLDELSNLERFQLAFNLATREAGPAIGDLARTQGSFNNQLNRARAEVSDLAAELGRSLLPAATSALQLFNRFVAFLGTLDTAVLTTTSIVGGLTLALTLLTGSPVIAGIGLLVTALAGLTAQASSFRTERDNLTQSIGEEIVGSGFGRLNADLNKGNAEILRLQEVSRIASIEVKKLGDDLIYTAGQFDPFNMAERAAIQNQEKLIELTRETLNNFGLEGRQRDAAVQLLVEENSILQQLIPLFERELDVMLLSSDELEKRINGTAEVTEEVKEQEMVAEATLETETAITDEEEAQLTILQRHAAERERLLEFLNLTLEGDNSREAMLQRQQALLELATQQHSELNREITNPESEHSVAELAAALGDAGVRLETARSNVEALTDETSELEDTTTDAVEVVDRLGEALEIASSASNFQQAIASIIELTSQLENAGDRTSEVAAEIERLATSSVSTGLQVAGSVVGNIQMISSAELRRQQAEEDILSARDEAEIQQQRDRLERFDEETAAQRANIERQIQDAEERRAALETLDMQRASARMNIEQQATNEIDRINRERAQRQYEIELQQFEAQKGFSIANAAIGAAQAIIQGFAQLGPIGGAIAAGVTAALTGVQIGIIASTPPPPPPALQEGGIIRATPGGTTAIIGEGRSDEAVLPLNEQVYTRLAKAIVDNLPRSSSNPITQVFVGDRPVATRIRTLNNNEIINTRTTLNNNNGGQ